MFKCTKPPITPQFIEDNGKTDVLVSQKLNGAIRFKAGRVVIVLSGRYAGKKAVVVDCPEKKGRQFQYAYVAGLSRQPRKVFKSMSKRRILQRSSMKSFAKKMNVQHLMPTRYNLDVSLKEIASEAGLKPEAREYSRKKLLKVFRELYFHQDKVDKKKTVGVQYFYKKLRF